MAMDVSIQYRLESLKIKHFINTCEGFTAGSMYNVHSTFFINKPRFTLLLCDVNLMQVFVRGEVRIYVAVCGVKMLIIRGYNYVVRYIF